MRILGIGGGPGGLYASILLKKLLPGAEVEVHERNQPDDTFGWGVVFSDETLGTFEYEDPASYHAIRESFIHWQDIDTFHRGEMIRSTGHGFSGLSRKRLLQILQARAKELGIVLHYGSEVSHPNDLGPADLIIGADGVNSKLRMLYADSFSPTLDWRRCRFCWLGTDRPLDAFTFIFKRNEHGLFRVHAYPFEAGLGTWIVECLEGTWKNTGLGENDEAATVAYCEKLFKDELAGHKLFTNRSIWRVFPTVRCERTHHENLVLIGDAAHTAHFSIGSGTKLAMEDAIALRDAVRDHGLTDVPTTLAAYDESRRVDVIKLQKAAQISLEWFENTERYEAQDLLTFTFNLMTRSKRITYDNLRQRDPELVREVAENYRKLANAPLDSDGNPPPPVFTPFKVGGLELPNRIVVSPMCQYMANDGEVGDWHLVHLGARALGGAGLIITEMTDVEPEGRITKGCAGLWNESHTTAWRRINDFVHANSKSAIGIQLAHAGRKGSTQHPWDGDDRPLLASEGAWTCFAPSAQPFYPDWPVPKEMDRDDMDRVCAAFERSTHLALDAGFDLVELHMAHGYLLSSFLSPLSNHRRDEYGGSLENRLRFPLEVLRAVRAAWPDGRPLFVRISATDWLDDKGGQTIEESIQIARALGEAGCDLIDVSTAGNSPQSRPIYGRMYQVPFAEAIRHETGIPVMSVGAILGADHANTILAAQRSDLCAMARPHLRDPHLTLHAASDMGFPDQPWPGPYLRGK
ncbi:MAG: FAD-dependent monooxygenase [Planctomycetes bacterium]|nr:FAD-dependent monooxygenase [Planctomycetota bacterium]